MVRGREGSEGRLNPRPTHQPLLTTTTAAPTTPSDRQILICQNLRNNLQHPNEYIRGVTLRFLCRIKVCVWGEGVYGMHLHLAVGA
jgi:hypothetical protein